MAIHNNLVQTFHFLSQVRDDGNQTGVFIYLAGMHRIQACGFYGFNGLSGKRSTAPYKVSSLL